MGTTIHLPLPRHHPSDQGPPKPNLTRFLRRLRRHVDRIPRRHPQRPASRCDHVHLPIPVRPGVLRLPPNNVGARHRDTAVHVVRDALVEFAVVGAGLRLGDEGVGRVRRAVHQEGAAAFGSVSGVFLLFDARVVDPFVLGSEIAAELASWIELGGGVEIEHRR